MLGFSMADWIFIVLIMIIIFGCVVISGKLDKNK
jgi:hypothetical protein